MFSQNQKSLWIGFAFFLAILFTRSSHFGTSVALPDATIAVLFLGGLFRFNLRCLVATIVLAFAIDFYAVGIAGVSDYCMSLGYWGLIPTYAMVWAIGRFTSKREHPYALTNLAPAALTSAALAFVMSNAFWYAFSDKVSTLTVYQFSQAVAQYFTPYVGYTMFYLTTTYFTSVAMNSIVAKKQSAA
jgi:hypothetical protein